MLQSKVKTVTAVVFVVLIRGIGILILAVLAFVPLPAFAADKELEHGFIDKVYKDTDGNEVKYVVFIPKDYKGDKPYPTIVFLHGKSQTGTDGRRQTKYGLGKLIRKDEDRFAFITIFPQSQKGGWNPTGDEGKRVMGILAEVQKTYKVDDKRLYLTGLSMGGFGTWSLAAAYPDKWAAIVPICGGGDPRTADKIKNIPCWCFHGDADETVKVESSRKMIDALKDAGAKPKYTEYPGVGHSCWDKAYGTPELFEWLLEQKGR